MPSGCTRIVGAHPRAGFRKLPKSIDRLLAAPVPALTIVMNVLVAIVMAAILLPLPSLTDSIQ